MQHHFHSLKGSGIVKTCCLTALFNALPYAYAQTSLPTTAYSREVLAVPSFPDAVEPADNILRYGPWDVLPRIRGAITYDDNIFIQPTSESDDLIWTISPGLTLGAGDYRVREGSSAVVDYAPSFNIFTDHSRNNSIDHDATLRGEWRPGRWSAALQQSYQNYSGPVLDVGNRIDRVTYNTAASFVYEISPKTDVEITGTQLVTEFTGLSSFNEWTLGGFFDYAVTPKIKAGLGINAGWVDIQNAGNQDYQQALLRAVYAVTEKVDFRGSVGIELRKFQTGQDDRANGVFSIGGTYKPIQSTQLLLDAYRRDQNSIVFPDQNYTTTGISLGGRHEFLVAYAATLTGGYSFLDYHSASPTVSATREDDYYFLRAAVDWQALDRLTAGISYLYRKNRSTVGNFSFSNHQVGLNLAYQF
jgi:hypothetical protein